MRKVATAPIRAYQLLVSPLLVAVFGLRCRFHPSCSQYAMEAIQKHGVMRGTVFAVKRVARCQPFFPGGYDPVP